MQVAFLLGGFVSQSLQFDSVLEGRIRKNIDSAYRLRLRHGGQTLVSHPVSGPDKHNNGYCLRFDRFADAQGNQ